MEYQRLEFFQPPFMMVPFHHLNHHHHVRYHQALHTHLLLQDQERMNEVLEHLRKPKYHHAVPREIKKNVIIRSIWMFPGDNMLKLNTDGSSKGNPGPSSFGGLIRDSKGKWVCGYIGKMNGRSFTSLEAEVWGLYRGLTLIRDKNLSNVLIETDCEIILRLKGQKFLDECPPLKAIVDAIGEMLTEFKCCMIHTRRDGNHCADQLAKLGGNQSEGYMVLDEPPALLIPYLSQDTKAAKYFERNRQHINYR